MSVNDRDKRRLLKRALTHPVFVQRNDARPSRRNFRNVEPAAPSLQDLNRVQTARRCLQFFCRAGAASAGWAVIWTPKLAILLDLFVQDHMGRTVSVSDACIAANVSPTSALRAIDDLLSDGAVERFRDPTDARRKCIALSQSQKDKLAQFLDSIEKLVP